jgi:hypothetical protein
VVSDANVTATVDLSDVIEGLKKLGEADAMAVLRSLRPAMRKDQQDHRRAQEGPDGKWPGRAQSTLDDLARRRRAVSRTTGRKRRSLRNYLLGRLPSAMDVKVEGKDLVARSRVRWSLAQYDGGRVGHGSVLPSRQWLWISNGLLDIVVGALEEAMPGWFGA